VMVTPRWAISSTGEAVPGFERPGQPGCGRTGRALAAQRRAASCSEREVGRMAVRKIEHPSIDERKAKGLESRDRASLSSHTKWRPAGDRPDPVALLQEQDATRE